MGGGREGERERGREGEREGGREGGREGEREGGREGGRERGREGEREREREGERERGYNIIRPVSNSYVIRCNVSLSVSHQFISEYKAEYSCSNLQHHQHRYQHNVLYGEDKSIYMYIQIYMCIIILLMCT